MSLAMSRTVATGRTCSTSRATPSPSGRSQTLWPSAWNEDYQRLPYVPVIVRQHNAPPGRRPAQDALVRVPFQRRRRGVVQVQLEVLQSLPILARGLPRGGEGADGRSMQQRSHLCELRASRRSGARWTPRCGPEPINRAVVDLHDSVPRVHHCGSGGAVPGYADFSRHPGGCGLQSGAGKASNGLRSSAALH